MWSLPMMHWKSLDRAPHSIPISPRTSDEAPSASPSFEDPSRAGTDIWWPPKHVLSHHTGLLFCGKLFSRCILTCIHIYHGLCWDLYLGIILVLTLYPGLCIVAQLQLSSFLYHCAGWAGCRISQVHCQYKVPAAFLSHREPHTLCSVRTEEMRMCAGQACSSSLQILWQGLI